MTNQGRFFIDLSAGTVFCRECRKRCSSLELPGYKLFWCSNKTCGNDDEVRQDREKGWEIYTVQETLRENAVSEITARLVRSIRSTPRRKSLLSKSGR